MTRTLGTLTYTNTDTGVVESLEVLVDGITGDFIPVRSPIGIPKTFTEIQLVAPGEQTTVRDLRGYTYLQFYVTVAAIDTSVTVGIYESHDAFATTSGLMAAPATLQENGTYQIVFTFQRPLGYVRLQFMDEVGGTSATIDTTVVYA